ncbi:MAG: domain S-box [Betaproteobacteria bacterium]|nr:domain S-box [Betaproteobacteria bacterium]
MASRQQAKKKPPRKRAATRKAPAVKRSASVALTSGIHLDQDFLTTVFNVARIGICLTDENGYFVEVNPAFCELFGYTSTELVRAPGMPGARPFLDFVHADDRSLVFANHLRRIRGEPITAYYPFRIVDKAQRVRWLEINAVLLKWKNRRTTLSFLLDVTERTALQQELRQGLIEREAILDNSLVGIAFLDAENRVKWNNRMFEQIYGTTRGELIGRHAEFAFPTHDDYIAFGRAAGQTIAAGGVYEKELPMQRQDGTRFSAFVSGKAIDNADLDKGIVWVVRDVTRRITLQRELSQTLLEREAILQSTLVGITFSVNRRHLWLNQTLARMLGYEVADLIGQLSVIHFPDQPSFDALGAAAYPMLASGQPYSTEAQMKRKDGSLVWCQVYGNAIDAHDLIKGTIWTFVDISERKRAEAEIHRALEKERELNELKSRFVAMTSHEFRTPLATILSSSELLEQYSEKLTANDKKEMFESIRAGVERMAKMLDDVLMIGRAEAHMVEFNPAPLNLAEFCERLVDETRRTKSSAHALAFSFDGPRRQVVMDEKLLRHALTNLLTNALKYSPDGGTIEFNARLADSIAEFDVVDHGIGIPAEDQARLFESFHRAGNVGTIAGTGLGLAIVKKSVDLQRGSISFNSRVGKGTRFTVAIPLS